LLKKDVEFGKIDEEKYIYKWNYFSENSVKNLIKNKDSTQKP